MSVGTLFFGLVIIGVGFVLIVLGINYFSSGLSGRLSDAKQGRVRERIATKALRSIANGAGNPIFEAQDALDQIEGTYIKEIN